MWTVWSNNATLAITQPPYSRHLSLPCSVPTLPVTPAELAVALALALVGSVLQGWIGIGLAVVAAPVLLLVSPVFVPGPMLLAAMLLVILIAVRERRDVIFRDVALASVGRVLGVLPAAYAISTLPRSVYELLFAALVLIGVAISLLGWHVRPTPWHVVLAAILSGFMGTMSSIGGPAMAIVYQNETGPRIRGTLSAIFTIGTVISITSLWFVGRFGAVELTLGLLLMPAVLIGFLLSRFTAKRLDEVHTRPAVLAISALSAVLIIVRALS
jgi:uncharacterized protein